MPGPNSIAITQLSRLIGTPDCPVILDVRLAQDFEADPRMIPTSLRADFANPVVPPGAKVVVVCHRGKKLSEGAAALLRAQGHVAEVLEGGNVAWTEAGLSLLPANTGTRTDLWVTRHRPKIDRIACPWLIRRFINPAAQFLFVTPTEVSAVASFFGATPFDIEGVTFTHRGDGCSFDAILDDFGLHSPALDRLAQVVRAADTDRHDLSPQAAGLLALSVGLSRQYRDDLQQLGAAMPLYDALYRWARDGFDEGHDWPAGAAA
jgi:rhodanese-related sulfurtransferase